MAKMFYTLEEAAERLGKSAEEVQQMVANNELQEFRDGDSLVVKREQVELLAGGDEDADESMIPLVDSAELEPLSLSSSGSGTAMGIEDPKEATGISIFDADDLDADDAAAQTQLTDDLGAEPEFMTMDSEGSGSGLLDLTREADDTSLGSDLLEDVYSGSGSEDAVDETMPAGADSNLFETTTETEGDLDAAPAVTVLSAEPYDGKGSVWVGAMAVSAIIVLAAGFAVATLAIISQSGNNPAGGIIDQFGDQWLIFAGAAAGLVIVPALLLGLLKKN